MLATVSSATLVGVDGHPVSVEVHVSNGLPGFRVVGLPDTSCREARDRVRAALISSGFAWPQKRITVNLAPSGLRKAGPGLDLAVALGVLAADGQIAAAPLAGSAFIAELGLDGSLRRVPGMLPLVAAAAEPGVVVPPSCGQEACLVQRALTRTAPTLRALVQALRGQCPWPELPPAQPGPDVPPAPDLAEVRGQPFGRQALEVAAAGGHHLLMVGPAGAGKTMLATRLPGLLPALSAEEALEVAMIHSAAGLDVAAGQLCLRPPFRSPHHSASAVSLIGGGGARLRPGEISCAHNGVLFLDELAEFPGGVLDNLRQPLEEGRVVVCRASGAVAFPARFMLVAAMNACRCDADGSPGSCRCSSAARARYMARLSGPLLDRFDLRVRVPRPGVEDLLRPGRGPAGDGLYEPSTAVAARVAHARRRARQRGTPGNAQLPAWQLDDLAPVSAGGRRLLERRLREGRLSARGLDRVRRVALTVADLAGDEPPLREEHILMALALRGPGADVSSAASGPGAAYGTDSGPAALGS
jgi:magnesium chelatase family protein